MSTNGFEFFEGTTTESSSTPKITVRKGGLLVLTQAAVAMMGDDVTHVRIGYNKDTRAIGICAASETDSGRYTLRKQKSTVSRVVDGKRFFAHHDLSCDSAQSFTAEEFGNGIIGFTLKNDSGEKAEAAEDAAPKKSRKASA